LPGVTFIDPKGKREEGPEIPLSPGRMTRSKYSQVANLRISQDVNTLSSQRMTSPNSRVTTPASNAPISN